MAFERVSEDDLRSGGLYTKPRDLPSFGVSQIRIMSEEVKADL